MRHVIVVLAVVFSLTSPAGAEDMDGPGRGVARISVINGDVSVRRGDSGDWVAAAPNAPLVVQDRVLTGPASRAEVQFDYANFLRLSSNSEIRLAELEHRRYQIQLAQGTAVFRVLRDSEADVEVSTPAVSVRPQKRGTYRVSVRDDGTTEITVRSGEVEVYTPRGVERLGSGKTMLARSTGSETEFQLVREIHEDDFDRWNERRDRDLERSRSYQYVHRDIYGAEDLHGHGTWVHVDTYGWVWRPHVHAHWAPYRYGRWSWIDWYGWTWVSHDPWGWAPYHYGRWLHHARHGWCWYPGGWHSRHYWRPALVAFFGIGSFRVGFGFGRVGWVPLAPYEPYYPWYGRRYYGRSYGYNSVNIVNNVNITTVYRNSRIRNAVSAVDGGDFARGRAGSVIRISDDDVRNVRLVRGAVPVTPERDSLRLADREARLVARDRPESRFFSRREPVAVEKVAFEEQRAGIERLTRGAARGNGAPASGEPAADLAGEIESRRSDRGRDARTGAADLNTATERSVTRDVGDQASAAGESGAAPGERLPRGEGRRSAAELRTSPAVESQAQAGGASDSGGVDSSGNALSERSAGRASSRGWRTIGETPETGRTSGAVTVEERGWRRFGDPGQAGSLQTAPERLSRGEARGLRTIERAEPGGASSRSEGWRRFGDPGQAGSTRTLPERPSRGEARQLLQAEPTDPADTSSRSQGWQRFGDPAAARSLSAEPPARTLPRDERQVDRSPDWRRFGDGSVPESQPRVPRSEQRTDRQRFERPQSPETRMSSPDRSEGGSRMPRGSSRIDRYGDRPSSLQLSPPVIREQSRPQRSMGGYERSMPRGEGRVSRGEMSRGSSGGAPARVDGGGRSGGRGRDR